MTTLSARAEAVTRRTYNRPQDANGTKFETWSDTVLRSHLDHHRRLMSDAGGRPDAQEFAEFTQLGMNRSGLVAGRTLWLGGTDYAYSRAASQFNCSGLSLDTVYDIVDAFWLLLNGCGVGGKPRSGTMHGYYQTINQLDTKHSRRSSEHRGREHNIEVKPTAANDYVWTIRIGDSAEAWAKALGKMMVSPRTRVDKLVLDYSELRGPGKRLRGYGWICNGYAPLAKAFTAIHDILNSSAGNLLTEEQIGDIFNWCGTVLSSRRAAESLLTDDFHPRVEEFSTRKHNHWPTNIQRGQSNNSVMFWRKPSYDELVDLIRMNLVGGEPGIVNAYAALRKCPWFKVFNPCFEICLPSHGFCNLVSLCLPAFKNNFSKLERATWLMARANYRQTCVNLQDNILQNRWNQTNEALRLCGVSYTGIVQAPWLTDYDITRLRNAAISGAYSMADELKMPRPKAVTTIKPEGTRSKISGTMDMEIAEGMHMPLGEHVFNWINFSTNDPMVAAMEAAGYAILPNPSDSNNVLVRFPVHYSNCKFTDMGGKRVNIESAVSQLNRYKRWNTLWADHNVSATISLDHSEVTQVAKWIYNNWDTGYIATAFMQRTDTTKSAKDLGFPYLPQDVVDIATFTEATSRLKPINWDQFHTGWYDIDDANCANGTCPIK
jgi:ribonucleoside-triphosphate reductase (formate)